MAISIKTEKEIAVLREGGRRLAEILQKVSATARPGVANKELNELALKLVAEYGDTPSFLNYSPKGAKRPFPAALCVSVNDKGLFTDGAITVGIGKIDVSAKKLIEVTRKALAVGIKTARAGATVGDIGFAIEKFVRPKGFGIVRELAGHGVGYAVHEEPFVPNFGRKGEGVELKEGMVLAIEPMLNEGNAGIKLDPDGYTYRTRDGSRSAHFEHTIVVTEKGAEILTGL